MGLTDRRRADVNKLNVFSSLNAVPPAVGKFWGLQKSYTLSGSRLPAQFSNVAPRVGIDGGLDSLPLDQ